MGPEDWDSVRAVGLDDEGCLELAHVVGVFNHLTRLADGLGIHVDPRVAEAAAGGPKLERPGAEAPRRDGPAPPDRHPRPPRLRLRLLGIAPAEATFERRGFVPAAPAAQATLEEAGRTFVAGYRAALADDRPPALETALEAVPLELRGFAYEGAAMALALLDCLAPWRRDRLDTFIAGPARPHVYMAHVGAGWAHARLRLGPRAARSLDPLLRWLALDGQGFHQGYFAPARHLREARVPRRIGGYALRAFDQGLGRSLWFAAGADPRRAAATVARFAPRRRADVWSGLGLAAAYAGGADRDALASLRSSARGFEDHVAQGAAFAAAARRTAGNPTAHTELAARTLAGQSAAELADLTDRARHALPPDGELPSYEIWRARIRASLGGESA